MPDLPIAPHLARPDFAVAGVDDWGPYVEAALRGFHQDYDEAVWQRHGDVFEPDRSIGFRVDGRWIATAAAYSRRLIVPGGSVPAAAVTVVTVQPTYRRRGLMRAMMEHQLADVRRRGEAVAVLWASEATIYGRFGYGHAAPRLRIEGATASSAFRHDVDLGAGSVAEVSREQALSVLPDLRRRWLDDRPGHLDRTPTWWEVTFHDPPAWRDGGAALRFVLHHGADGQVDGYAVFRVKGAGSGEELEVRVVEIDAADPSGRAALWRFLLDLDLVRAYRMAACAPDEPLRHLVADDRSVRSTLIDGLYVRIVDLPTALTTRTYATPVDMVLDVTDTVITANDGRWRLRSDGTRTEVVRLAARPETTGVGRDEPGDSDPARHRPGREGSGPHGGAEVSLDIRELAAGYLGGVSLATSARAGLVREHVPGAVSRLALAFGADRAPFCPDPF